MTSSAKPEVHDALRCRRRGTELRPRVTRVENFVWTMDIMAFEKCEGTGRPTDIGYRHADRNPSHPSRGGGGGGRCNYCRPTTGTNVLHESASAVAQNSRVGRSWLPGLQGCTLHSRVMTAKADTRQTVDVNLASQPIHERATQGRRYCHTAVSIVRPTFAIITAPSVVSLPLPPLHAISPPIDGRQRAPGANKSNYLTTGNDPVVRRRRRQ